MRVALRRTTDRLFIPKDGFHLVTCVCLARHDRAESGMACDRSWEAIRGRFLDPAARRDRMSPWTEGALLFLIGVLLGGGLCQLKRGPALGLAVVSFVVLSLAGIGLSYCTNFWFP